MNESDVRKFTIPRLSVREQRRIAEILDTVDNLIRAADRIISKLQTLRTALLSETVWSVPAQRVSLNDMASGSRGLTIGPFGSDLVAADYRSRGVPVIFVQDVRNGDVVQHKSRVFVTDEKARQLSAHSILPGDVAITKMGEPPGVAALYSRAMSPGVITADIVRLRCDRNVVEPEWAAEAINSPRFQAQVRSITAGVTRSKITLRDFRQLRLHCPTLEVQRSQIIAVREIDGRLRLELASLRALQAIRTGLANDLLSGQVRAVGS